MKRQSGFTLVEIAIVLVVIGLLLGGVLKGQELVLNSQIRNAINEYNNVASARFAYQDRYRQIPGDDITAGGAAGRWPAATSGNGDRIIQGNWNDIAATEASLFWQHLRNDRLVVGPVAGAGSTVPPRNAFDGFIGVQSGALAIGLDAICQGNIPSKAAIIIDTRIDDEGGNGAGGATGILQAVVDTAGASVAPGAAAAAYAGVNSANRYIMCREL